MIRSKLAPRKAATIATCLAAACVMTATPAIPQAPAGAHMGGQAVAPSVQRIVLPLGKSAVVDLPVAARDVVIANPEVADAVMRTSRRAFLLGLKNGETNVYFLDDQGRQILALEVRVARDTSELSALIQRLAPEARVNIDAVGDSILLTGDVQTASDADRILRVAQQYAGAPEKVVNMMSVVTSDQVLLQVRVIEMQRSVIRQLGINLSATNLLNQLLPDDWGLNFATSNGFAASGSFLGGSALGASWARNFIRPSTVSYDAAGATPLDPSVFAGAGGYSETFNPDTGITEIKYGPGTLTTNERADTNIQALERTGLARTLAQQEVTALSGTQASFLAGGEFPVPVAQEGNRISVEFKPFGVALGFTPVVHGPDRITVQISTEVSEISTSASFRQPDTVIRNAAGEITDTIRGLSIPGISTRRAETTAEAASGKSIVIAGLIQQQTRQSIEGLPGLMNLPTLGNLFRSRDFQNNETELVIIITPYLVRATSMDRLQTPADGYQPASEPASLLMGRLNRVVRPQAGTRTPPGRYRAPVGHTLH
jgi:pilus assembly protein CpaC